MGGDAVMLTEEEAKKKWCPFVRHPQFGNTQDLKGTRCISSECMAWRWVDRVCKHKERGTLHDASVMNDRFSDAAEYELLPQRGYCGLAGAP